MENYNQSNSQKEIDINATGETDSLKNQLSEQLQNNENTYENQPQSLQKSINQEESIYLSLDQNYQQLENPNCNSQMSLNHAELTSEEKKGVFIKVLDDNNCMNEIHIITVTEEMLKQQENLQENVYVDENQENNQYPEQQIDNEDGAAMEQNDQIQKFFTSSGDNCDEAFQNQSDQQITSTQNENLENPSQSEKKLLNRDPIEQQQQQLVLSQRQQNQIVLQDTDNTEPIKKKTPENIDKQKLKDMKQEIQKSINQVVKSKKQPISKFQINKENLQQKQQQQAAALQKKNTVEDLKQQKQVSIQNLTNKYYKVCSICNEPLKQQEQPVKSLSCTHRFHEKCLGRNNVKCPTCNSNLDLKSLKSVATDKIQIKKKA